MNEPSSKDIIRYGERAQVAHKLAHLLASHGGALAPAVGAQYGTTRAVVVPPNDPLVVINFGNGRQIELAIRESDD